MAGIIHASRLRSVSTNIGGTLVLYAVAAAVIGGTSLFGGRVSLSDRFGKGSRLGMKCNRGDLLRIAV